MSLITAEIREQSLQNIKDSILPTTKIMAVTKTLSHKAIESAIKHKIYLIGENRIQETEEKIKMLDSKYRKKIKLHLIGNLQTNKIKKAIDIYDVIETVYREKQLVKINKHAFEKNKIQKIYIQVNIGKDIKKQGVFSQKLNSLMQKAQNMKNVSITGLMTILPNLIEEKKKKQYYKNMLILFNKTKKEYKSCINLSMGMSGDYHLASQEGSTQIRIGTFLYGKRKNI